MEAPELDRSIVQVPLAVVDFDETDVLLPQDVADVDPALVPADAAVGADPAHLVVGGVLERRQLRRIRPRRGLI